MSEPPLREALDRLAIAAHGYFEHQPGVDFSELARPQLYLDMSEDIFHIVTRAGLRIIENDETDY